MSEKKITAKRQKHLDRQAKKKNNQYTKEERQEEISKCITKLDEVGLYRYYSDDMEKIHTIMEEYVKTGEPVNGNVPIVGTKRIFCYLFPKYKITPVSTVLKYDKNI